MTTPTAPLLNLSNRRRSFAAAPNLVCVAVELHMHIKKKSIYYEIKNKITNVV